MLNPVTAADVQLFAERISEDTANAMLSSVWARAVREVPELKDHTADADDTALVKTIIRAAVVRWYDSGSGAVTSRGAGDFSEYYRRDVEGLGGTFTKDELNELRAVVGLDQASGSASTVLTYPLPEWPTVHPFVAPEGI